MTERRKEVGALREQLRSLLGLSRAHRKRDDLRRQVASAINKEMNLDIPLDQVGCDGCWGGIHTAWAASIGCRIRQCVEAKNFATCADCADFPCSIYLKQFADDSGQAKNIKKIKQVGLDAWIIQSTDVKNNLT